MDRRVFLGGLIGGAAAIALTGCGPSTQELKKMDFGPRPKSIPMGTVKKYMSQFLKDPYSARIELVKQPYKRVYEIDKWSQLRWKGWVGKIRVNAKNSYGAYTGYKTYYVAVDSYGVLHGIYEFSGRSLAPYPAITWIRFVD